MTNQLDLFGNTATPKPRPPKVDTALLLAMSTDHTSASAASPPKTKPSEVSISDMAQAWREKCGDEIEQEQQQAEAEAAAELEAGADDDSDPIGAALLAKDLWSSYSLMFDYSSAAPPETLTGQWAAPSGLFQFPVGITHPDDGPRRIYLRHNALRLHPFVTLLEAEGFTVLDADAEESFAWGNHGQWHHAVDLASAGEVDALIATRNFTDDNAISAAVEYALNYKSKLTLPGARKLMALFNWPELPADQLRSWLSAPEEVTTGEKPTGWPIRFPRCYSDRNTSHGRAWCYIIGIEQGWITHDRSGFARWSEKGKQWWDQGEDSLL